MLKGTRKIWVIVGITSATLSISTAMVLLGHMTAAEWVELAKWIGTGGPLAFAIGNGLEHIGNGKKVV